MHEKGCSPKKDSTAFESVEKLKESKIPNAPASVIGSKSSSFRQCKSFNMKESMLPKPPSSQESSRTAKSNGASSRMEASVVAASFENGGRALKLNGVSKSGDPVVAQAGAKPKQKDNTKLDPKAEILPLNSRSERVNSPRNGGILRSSSSNRLNATIRQTNVQPAPTTEGASKVTRIKDSSPPSTGLANGTSLSSSLNADPQKKLPPIKTARLHGSRKSASSKNSANLCAECKAELEGAVCFIGNDGRVSACTSRTAVRLCKNLKCANNNPEHVASVAAAISAPKKYLVSRRHSLPPSGSRSSKGGSDKEHAQVSNQNSTTSMRSGDADASIPHNDTQEHESCEEFDMQGELEDDVTSLEDMGEVVEIDGVASASPHRGRPGFRQMRRRSFSVIEKQGQEVVTLKKQMMQERRQAEEWMLDYAIEEALHRLAPSKDSKVKALVEAFESVIVPQKDADTVHDHCDGSKTPTIKSSA